MIRSLIPSKNILLYGLALGVLLILLKFLEWKLVINDNQLELYTGCIAAFFMGFGIWLSFKLRKPKTETIIETIVIEKEVAVPPVLQNQEIDEERIKKLQISKRELEVLQLMAGGFSNQEIADRLFVSANTIKTHVSRIFEKLDAKRRTQAIEIAKQLKIII